MLNSDISTPASPAARQTTRLRDAARFLLPIFACVVIDQLTKRWATNQLRNSEVLSFWGDSLRLQYAMNSGGFLSLGSQFSESTRFGLFIVFNLVLMCGLAWFLFSASGNRRTLNAGVGLLFAGGIGNLIDRITQNGQVTDFINMGIGPFRTGIFNIADVAILIGAALVAGGSWLHRPKSDVPLDAKDS